MSDFDCDDCKFEYKESFDEAWKNWKESQAENKQLKDAFREIEEILWHCVGDLSDADRAYILIDGIVKEALKEADER